MDFSYSEEQTSLRDLARKIFEDLATNDRLKEIERRDPVFDENLWNELARANLLGVALPESLEGSGFGFFELCLLLQEMGRAVAPVPLVPTLVLGALPLERYASEELKQHWLPRVCRGEAILTAALLEPDAPDPRDPQARAKRVESGWQIEGTKTNVPAGPLANALLVSAQMEGGGVGVFLVDAHAEGVEIRPQQTSDRQPHAWIEFSGVTVDESHLLGAPDPGREVLDFVLDHAVLAHCAVQLGVSERALEMTAEYARERVQFDRPIGSFQAVHQRAADAYIQVEAMRLCLWEAAWQIGEGREAQHAIAIAKFWAAEGGQFVAYACQHLHGGIGIDVDYPLHRYFLWSMQNEHAFGAASAQLADLGVEIAARESQ